MITAAPGSTNELAASIESEQRMRLLAAAAYHQVPMRNLLALRKLNGVVNPF